MQAPLTRSAREVIAADVRRRETLANLERAIAVRERELAQLKVIRVAVVRGHDLSADGHAFVYRVLADEGT